MKRPQRPAATPLQHARYLYGQMLTSLSKFQRARVLVQDAVERARKQAERERTLRDYPEGSAFHQLVEQIADRDPTATSAMNVSNRHRDDAMVYALAYLVETHYAEHTYPFIYGPAGDGYSNLRGGASE